MITVIRGMHGLGDNLHQRAVVRQLLERGPVYLETPWPAIYSDLPGVHLIAKPSALRTQAKNAAREAVKFERGGPPRGAAEVRLSYAPEAVRRLGSVLAAMMEVAGCDFKRADFRLPVPAEWLDKADTWIRKWAPTKPLLIYRPLVERTEWSGSRTRNPDFAAYAALLRSIRKQFFVVSIADLVPKVEWTVGEDIAPDVALHAGELDIETLAGLTKRAKLVFASPGFMVPLAEAVGTPVVCVFGGYENSSSFSAGAKFAPYLGIDPVQPCQCWSHTHACRKTIDMPGATRRLKMFADQALSNSRPSVKIDAPKATLPAFPPRYFNPGELDTLVHLIASIKPRVVIEFGCNEGRAAATVLANVLSIEEYVGIDVLPGYVTQRECQRKEVPAEPGKYAKADPRFRLIVKPRGAFDLTADDLPAADACFIDADHSRAGVLNDHALAMAATRPGGIIIHHDDNGLPAVEVSETLDELHTPEQPIIHVDSTWFAFTRIGAKC